MTAIFLLFEITASYQVIVPIMITCVIGTTISRHFNKESLETEDLARAGIDLRGRQGAQHHEVPDGRGRHDRAIRSRSPRA